MAHNRGTGVAPAQGNADRDRPTEGGDSWRRAGRPMSEGQISPDEASSMSTVLDAQRRAIETTELVEEIERIKERLEMDGKE
jgi:hypothetical protein